MPALLTFDDTVFAKHQTWIGKHSRRDLIIDVSMLPSIEQVLFAIPFEKRHTHAPTGTYCPNAKVIMFDPTARVINCLPPTV